MLCNIYIHFFIIIEVLLIVNHSNGQQCFLLVILLLFDMLISLEYKKCSWFTKPASYVPEGKKIYKITDMELCLNNQMKYLGFRNKSCSSTL